MHPANDDIAALEHNLWSMFSVLGVGDGGHVVDTPTRLVVTSPVQSPPYNGVWRFYDEGDRPLATQVDEALGPFRERGVPAVWILHPTAPRGLGSELEAAGLTRAEGIVGMVADLAGAPPAPEPPTGIKVVEASRSSADADAWLHLVTWRYGLDRSASPYLKQIYERAIGGHTRLWLALLDGEPVSKAAMHVHGGVAGIYAVATTDNGRRRGLASLLTLTALSAARAEGVERSVLHSTPMAVELYRKLGFRDAAPFEVWAEPGTLHL
jgi:GNAT superfamily N-acetyltransferase